ncbi:glycosyltransferase [Paenibacillus polymyxa]|uniref:glycosyltransferase n=1 Tax=Paenibacillus polymyxa TaxID=1406 RepID=UPI002379696A|nr:glycosyltransferase [Paenibacillus polymyxa]WDM21583.1 glycosyltransferase family 4 protein [Paenibacillus polymyxa]
MIINQLLPTISYGDAVSNSAVNIMKILHDMGIESSIYAQNIHPKMGKYAKHYKECPKKDPLIYHLSTGSEVVSELLTVRAKKIVYYHNITPPHFFNGYSGVSRMLCEQGRNQLRELSDQFTFSLAASEYNRLELEQNGYKNTQVMPIIINYEDYDQAPDNTVLNDTLQDGWVNLIFVGRIAPNKKQEDVIKTFFYYKKYINQKSRLFLVGSYQGMERYYEELLRLIKTLGLSDVHITGHLPFNQIIAYYKSADLFLSMSEHEGFGVPFVEAMKFDLPIIAFKSSAVGETISNAGLLTLDKDYILTAELIDYVLRDTHIQQRLKFNRAERLNYYSKENTSFSFRKFIEQTVDRL